MASPIEYSIIEKEVGRTYEDADYREEMGVEDMEDALRAWMDDVIGEFNSFEHHPKSGLFGHFGRDYADESERYLQFPEMVSGGYNYGSSSEYDYPMMEKLREALSYRIDMASAGKAKWKVFDKITGKYSVSVVDNEVLALRAMKLEEFLNLINQDEKLKRIDPQTGKEAITKVDPDTSEMTGIQYFFPIGLEDTSELHYMVLEAPQQDIDPSYGEINLFDLITTLTMEQIINRKGPAIAGSIMGQLMAKRSDLREMAKSGELMKTIGEIVGGLNEELETNGLEPIASRYVPLEEEIIQEETGTLEETYKKIGVKALIKKASKDLAKNLNLIRPPVGGDKGGSDWPKSSSGQYLLEITNRPFDVITKSTGRPWGWKEESCEVWYGCYRGGPVDDVKQGNAVVWIYRGDEIKPNQKNLIGRMSLRWGNAYKSEQRIGVDIGIEGQTYPKGAAWGNDIGLALIKILKGEGLLDYDYCKTPYAFKGYSDYNSGPGKTTYSQVRLKGKGTIEEEGFDFNRIASDPQISFNQLGWVLTQARTTPQIYGALSQNTTLWAYPNPLTRYIRNIRNLDETTTKLYTTTLIDSPAADFSFFDYIIDHIEDYDYQYKSWQHSIIPAILNSPHCPPYLHKKIREEFPQFKSRSGREVGGVDEVVYLNLLSAQNHFNMDFNRHICTAPTDIVSELVDKIVSGERLPGREGRRRTYRPIDPLRYPEDFGISEEEVAFFWKWRDYLVGTRNLIYAPNMDNDSFIKLYDRFINFAMEHAEEWEDFEQVPVLISKISQDFRNVIVLPFRESTDYGYQENLPDGTFIGMGAVAKDFKYQIQEKQTPLAMEILMDMRSGMKQLDFAFGGFSTDWIMENIRDGGVLNLLWRKRERYNIPATKFLMARKSRKMSEWKTEYTFFPYMDAEFQWSCLLEAWNSGEDLTSLATVGGTLIERNNRKLRTFEEVSITMMDYLFNHPRAMDIINDIGWEFVALWLQHPLHFSKYELALYNYIFPDERLMALEEGEKLEDGSEVLLDIQDKIHCLALASSGWVNEIGGLGENPNTPPELITKMISTRKKSSWIKLDDKFGGDYYQYNNLLAQKLLRNSATPSNVLMQLVRTYPQYKEMVASNPNAPPEILMQEVLNNPIEALCNPNLSNLGDITYGDIIEDVFKILQTEEIADAGRLFKILNSSDIGPFTEGLENSMRKDLNPSSKIATIAHREREYNWLRYWRGGTCKKKMPLGIVRDRGDYRGPSNLNPKISERSERPEAIINNPEDLPSSKIFKNQIIIDMDFDNDLYSQLTTMSDELPTIVRFREIQQITPMEDGKIHVVGRQKTKSPQNRGRWGKLDEVYENIDEMYGYIPAPDISEVLSPQIMMDDSTQDTMENILGGWSWKHSVTIVLQDDREDFAELPLWRRTWSEEDMRRLYECLVENNSIDDDTLLYALMLLMNNRGYRVRASEREESQSMARFYPERLVNMIDRDKRWTPRIMDALTLSLLNPNGEYYMPHYENLHPTSEFLEFTLMDPLDAELNEWWDMKVDISQDIAREILGKFPSLSEQYYSSSVFIHSSNKEYVFSGIPQTTRYILDKFGLEIPISYIYFVMREPYISSDVKSRAVNLHRERIREYIKYVSGLHQAIEGEGMIIEA